MNYIEEVKKILAETPIYGDNHKRFFESYNYGEQTPVSTSSLYKMPNGKKVTITEDMLNRLTKLQYFTKEFKEEAAFILLGIEKENELFFEDIIVEESTNPTEAAFSQETMEKITRYCNGFIELGKKPAIAHGHSHPRNSEFYEEFSIADLAAYMELKESYKPFKEHKAEVSGCLLVDNKFNFLFYDNDYRNFYRFEEAYVEYDNGEKDRLPCYHIKGTLDKDFDREK